MALQSELLTAELGHVDKLFISA